MSAKLTVSGFISKNPATGKLQLEERISQKSGQPLLKGVIYWLAGEKDGKKQYADIKFVAYGEAVDFIKNNVDKMLEFKDCPFNKVMFEDKKNLGKWVTYFEIAVFGNSVGLYQKKEPVKAPTEVDNNELNSDIPF